MLSSNIHETRFSKLRQSINPLNKNCRKEVNIRIVFLSTPARIVHMYVVGSCTWEGKHYHPLNCWLLIQVVVSMVIATQLVHIYSKSFILMLVSRILSSRTCVVAVYTCACLLYVTHICL